MADPTHNQPNQHSSQSNHTQSVFTNLQMEPIDPAMTAGEANFPQRRATQPSPPQSFPPNMGQFQNLSFHPPLTSSDPSQYSARRAQNNPNMSVMGNGNPNGVPPAQGPILNQQTPSFNFQCPPPSSASPANSTAQANLHHNMTNMGTHQAFQLSYPSVNGHMRHNSGGNSMMEFSQHPESAAAMLDLQYPHQQQPVNGMMSPPLSHIPSQFDYANVPGAALHYNNGIGFRNNGNSSFNSNSTSVLPSQAPPSQAPQSQASQTQTSQSQAPRQPALQQPAVQSQGPPSVASASSNHALSRAAETMNNQVAAETAKKGASKAKKPASQTSATTSQEGNPAQPVKGKRGPYKKRSKAVAEGTASEIPTTPQGGDPVQLAKSKRTYTKKAKAEGMPDPTTPQEPPMKRQKTITNNAEANATVAPMANMSTTTSTSTFPSAMMPNISSATLPSFAHAGRVAQPSFQATNPNMVSQPSPNPIPPPFAAVVHSAPVPALTSVPPTHVVKRTTANQIQEQASAVPRQVTPVPLPNIPTVAKVPSVYPRHTPLPASGAALASTGASAPCPAPTPAPTPIHTPTQASPQHAAQPSKRSPLGLSTQDAVDATITPSPSPAPSQLPPQPSGQGQTQSSPGLPIQNHTSATDQSFGQQPAQQQAPNAAQQPSQQFSQQPTQNTVQKHAHNPPQRPVQHSVQGQAQSPIQPQTQAAGQNQAYATALNGTQSVMQHPSQHAIQQQKAYPQAQQQTQHPVQPATQQQAGTAAPQAELTAEQRKQQKRDENNARRRAQRQAKKQAKQQQVQQQNQQTQAQQEQTQQQVPNAAQQQAPNPVQRPQQTQEQAQQLPRQEQARQRSQFLTEQFRVKQHQAQHHAQQQTQQQAPNISQQYQTQQKAQKEAQHSVQPHSRSPVQEQQAQHLAQSQAEQHAQNSTQQHQAQGHAHSPTQQTGQQVLQHPANNAVQHQALTAAQTQAQEDAQQLFLQQAEAKARYQAQQQVQQHQIQQRQSLVQQYHAQEQQVHQQQVQTRAQSPVQQQNQQVFQNAVHQYFPNGGQNQVQQQAQQQFLQQAQNTLQQQTKAITQHQAQKPAQQQQSVHQQAIQNAQKQAHEQQQAQKPAQQQPQTAPVIPAQRPNQVSPQTQPPAVQASTGPTGTLQPPTPQPLPNFPDLPPPIPNVDASRLSGPVNVTIISQQADFKLYCVFGEQNNLYAFRVRRSTLKHLQLPPSVTTSPFPNTAYINFNEILTTPGRTPDDLSNLPGENPDSHMQAFGRLLLLLDDPIKSGAKAAYAETIFRLSNLQPALGISKYHMDWLRKSMMCFISQVAIPVLDTNGVDTEADLEKYRYGNAMTEDMFGESDVKGVDLKKNRWEKALEACRNFTWMVEWRMLASRLSYLCSVDKDAAGRWEVKKPEKGGVLNRSLIGEETLDAIVFTRAKTVKYLLGVVSTTVKGWNHRITNGQRNGGCRNEKCQAKRINCLMHVVRGLGLRIPSKKKEPEAQGGTTNTDTNPSQPYVDPSLPTIDQTTYHGSHPKLTHGMALHQVFDIMKAVQHERRGKYWLADAMLTQYSGKCNDCLKGSAFDPGELNPTNSLFPMIDLLYEMLWEIRQKMLEWTEYPWGEKIVMQLGIDPEDESAREAREKLERFAGIERKENAKLNGGGAGAEAMAGGAADDADVIMGNTGA